MKFHVGLFVLIWVFADSQTFATITCGSNGTYLTSDCSSFYQCANGVPYLYHCALTHTKLLASDPSSKSSKMEYNCTILLTTNGTSEPTDHNRIYLLNPDDCRTFFEDANGVPMPNQLPHCSYTSSDEVLFFDPSVSVCVQRSEYDCSKSVKEPSPSCFEFSHPAACLRSPNNCSFCFDTRFRAANTTRYDKYENLRNAGCRSFELDREDYDSIVETSPNCSSWLLVEPGKKRKVSVTICLEKQPLDFYYLMDFSSSMADDKRKLITLSADLLKTLANLTNDFHIGFGSFVDKPIFPFGDGGDYSFHNDFPLTADTDGLVEKIQAIPIKNDIDKPEAHADALAQLIGCAEQIGWRDNSRHVVLVSTDTNFHMAGDGLKSRPPTEKPYVEGCYLSAIDICY